MMFPRNAVFRLGRYDVSAKYWSAEPEPGDQIGGDWYDALIRSDGSAVVIIGDVAGHGSRAAGRMMRIAAALRNMCFTGQPANSLLGCLNRLVYARECPELVVSAAVCVLDQERPALHWAQAGHLPPVLLSGGAARLLERPRGQILGAAPAAEYDLGCERLAAGDTVFLYTDGLIERRGRDIAQGLGALLAAASGSQRETAAQSADVVLGRLRLPPTNDDTCLVAVRVSADS